MDPEEIRLIQKAFTNERGAEASRMCTILWEPFKHSAPPGTAVCNSETNFQSENEIHRALGIGKRFVIAGPKGPEGIFWAVSNRAEQSLRRCQYRGAFLVPLPTEKNNILGLKCHCAICNRFQKCSQRRCQQLYVVNKRPLCAPLAICLQITNSCRRWRCNFKGLSLLVGRTDFLKSPRLTVSWRPIEWT